MNQQTITTLSIIGCAIALSACVASAASEPIDESSEALKSTGDTPNAQRSCTATINCGDGVTISCSASGPDSKCGTKDGNYAWCCDDYNSNGICMDDGGAALQFCSNSAAQ
jgi:hypothetical protein